MVYQTINYDLGYNAVIEQSGIWAQMIVFGVLPAHLPLVLDESILVSVPL